MPAWLVEQFSTRTFRQLVNSMSGGRRMPLVRVDAAVDCGLADDLAGATMAMFSVSVAEMKALYPLIQRPSQRTCVKRIIGHVAGAEQRSILIETQRHVVAKHERTGEVVARGNEDITAAEHGAAIDRLLQREGVFGLPSPVAPMSRTLSVTFGPTGAAGALDLASVVVDVFFRSPAMATPPSDDNKGAARALCAAFFRKFLRSNNLSVMQCPFESGDESF